MTKDPDRGSSACPALERLLIVGLGSVGARHARIARSIAPNVQITAWRRSSSGGTRIDGIDRTVATLDDALAGRPQLAVIASPATRHLEAALPLAAAGVHLLVEKPIAASVDGVDELIETCKRSGVHLMTGYNLRFLPSLQCLREQVREGRVGRVLSVRAEVGQSLPTWRATDYRASVSARADLGGGVLLELSHEIDYLRWVFGEIEWVSATLLRQSALDIDVEDTAHLVLGFAPSHGTAAVVAALNMDFVRHDSTRGCVVVGEAGTLRWNGPTGRVDVFEAGGAAWQDVRSLPSGRDDSYIAEWKHLLSCLGTGTPPSIRGEDGLAVLRVVDAARRSAASGTRVWLDRDRVGNAAPVAGP